MIVADIDHFAERGGVIGFLMEGRTLRSAINRDAGEPHHLKISSKLMTLAVIVGSTPPALPVVSGRPDR